MSDEPTCGKGLAEHSVIPAKIAELIDALAENLELHIPALLVSDPAARAEHAAYDQLATAYRSIAKLLATTAKQMASYRDLPMGKHDEQVMTDPKLLEAFGQFVARERELIGLLQASIARDQELLR